MASNQHFSLPNDFLSLLFLNARLCLKLPYFNNLPLPAISFTILSDVSALGPSHMLFMCEVSVAVFNLN